MNWFNNLSIKYKIGAIALIGVIALVVSLAVNYRLVSNVNVLLGRTIESQMPTLQFINELQVGFAEIKELYQAAIITSDDSSMQAANNNVRLLMSQFYEAKSKNAYHAAKLELLIDSLKAYTDAIAKQTELVLSGADIASPEVVEGFARADNLREEYEDLQRGFISDWEHDFKNDLLLIQENENKILGGGTVIGLIAFGFLAFFSVLIIRQITLVLGNAVTVADKIASGDLKQDIAVLAKDESGQLMESLRVMRDALNKQQEEAGRRDSLQSALAGLNETMRGDQDIEVLAVSIIEYLATATQSTIGAFYLLQGSRLSLLASYAFTVRRGGDSSFEVGESIVGQCALERKPFIVTDLPPDYVQVMSGLGQASPSSLIVFPVELDGQLLGVIELGSFRRFGEREMEFVEKGREGVAIAINSAQARVRMAEVLQQTRTQAEELKLQQEQMELINAELEERSKALDKQKNEVLQKNNELERSKNVLLEKSKALEASDRYKTQFLSTMSHELRTPLNSILILSQALIENKKGNLSEKEVQHAHVIHSSGSDLLTLINDILDLSKIEEGKLDLVYEQTSLKDFAAELNKRFEFVAGNKGLEFKVSIAEDMPETVVTDTHRFNQVLKNFISNAIKFTEKGGVYIDIHRPRPPFVPVHSMLSQKDSFVVAVRDTGIGIPKDKQDIIFEAFKQADGTTSRKYGGTGLGLTISRELGNLLGGEISVHSEGEGSGSTFYVILPFDSSRKGDATGEFFIEPAVVKESSPATQSSKMPDADKAAILAMFEQAGSSSAQPVATDFGNSHFSQAQKVDRILIVEDDYKFAQILNELILEAGLFCDLVHTGEDAVMYLEHYRPQAVILDISLPDISGWDILKKIKASLKAQSIPVHVVSAMPEKHKAIQRGAEDFTEKPVSQDDVQELLAKIKEEIGTQFRRVLLVEDNISLHEAIVEQFESKGIHLDVVATGEQGLEKIRHDAFDCLIVDLMLPDMDGIELLSKVRQLPDYAETPIIVFTAQEMSAEREFEISKYSDRVIIKSGQAMERLVHTVSMFLGDVSKGIQTESANAVTIPVAVKEVPVLLFVCLAFLGCEKKQGDPSAAGAPAGQTGATEQAAAPPESDVILLGEVGSLTGAQATFGISTRNGIELALERVNNEGGVKGKPVRVRVYDNQGKPEESANAVTRLIAQDGVKVILGEVASTNSLAMAPKAQAAGVPMITPSSTNPKVTQVGDFIFRVCFIDPFQGFVMAKFAREDLKAATAAILEDTRSDYSVGLAGVFAERFVGFGGKVVKKEAYAQGDTDFRAQLTSIKASKPDVLFIPGYYTDVGLIARQARQLGLTAVLLGGDGWESDKLFELGGSAIDGAYYSNHYSVDDPSPLVKEFLTAYQAKFGSVPDSLAALGYDAAMVAVDALKRSPDTSGAALRDAIRGIKDFPGVAGTINLDAERNAVKPAVVLKVTAGKAVYVKTIAP